MIVLCAIVLNGCTEGSNYYGGIKKTDYPEMTDPNIEYVYEFKGHSDNWGAVMFVYKMKNSDKVAEKEFLVYNGKDPKPTGEISTGYAVGDAVGGGSITVKETPEKGIYLFGPSAGTVAPTQDSTVKLLVKWKGHSEIIELKTETK